MTLILRLSVGRQIQLQTEKRGGVIGFITNGSWIDSKVGKGFRETIKEEFSSIYVFNLRGNLNIQDKIKLKKEGGGVFSDGNTGGCKLLICITFLVKKPNTTGNATIHYHDIGDCLSSKEKLEKIKSFKSILNETMELKTLKPDKYGDWINQREGFPNHFIPLFSEISGKNKFNLDNESFFATYSNGIKSHRDHFVSNFSKEKLIESVVLTIDHYRDELERTKNLNTKSPKIDNTKGVWTDNWKKTLKKGRNIGSFDKELMYSSIYRPFTITNRYFADDLNERRAKTYNLFPDNKTFNLTISIPVVSGSVLFSTIITNKLMDVGLTSGQGFPLHFYLGEASIKQTALEKEISKEAIKEKQSNITDYVLQKAEQQYGIIGINKEDIFFYVYGFLHSAAYKKSFEKTLVKEHPKIPLVKRSDDFWSFSKAGRELADLHINYETIPPHPEVKVTISEKLTDKDFEVIKMKHSKHKRQNQLDTIIFNDSISITNIPIRAYDYIINGKSAIEWIMSEYQVKTHSKSKLVNNPNHWGQEHNNPRYILDLLLSVINLSIKTLDIIERLPKIKF